MHAATEALLKSLTFIPVPSEYQTAIQAVRDDAKELAEHWANTLPDGPEVTAAIRKLREAKDCAVHAIIAEATK